MEVHAHTHTPRKKWTHYFWEFLMLFLAVFCGFLAENYREHQVEHQREKQYIKTFISDLKSDTGQTRTWANTLQDFTKGLDSLMAALKTSDAIEKPDAINRYSGYAQDDIQFIPAGRTMQQLKNSGNMRLIRKTIISDSLVLYDQLLEFVSERYQGMSNMRNEVLSLMDEIVDENASINTEVINGNMVTISHPGSLLIKDRHKLDVLFNKIKRLKSHEMLYRQAMNFVHFFATSLIKLMQKEYHLK